MKFLLQFQETERLAFREIRKTDFDSWLAFHQNPASTKHWKGEFESPEKECKKWYENQFKRYEEDRGGMNALIEKYSGKLIGHCGLLVQEVDTITELEIGYSLLPEFWNKGYATEAARKCRDFAFENNFSESLISIISLTNSPSERVALKNGMQKDKVTIYKGNEVNIFRINKTEWHPS
jgi:RimJ/RimL family protein N-acetyltransferase